MDLSDAQCFVHLRKLREDDAALMLEWMQDRSVVDHLNRDFTQKTLEDCRDFIRNSHIDSSSVHLAIVDDQDVYMGTVSLKEISRQDQWAEFGICMRSIAMGKGFAKLGMEAILRYGFSTLELDTIYWCVSCHNERANRFYKKNGYRIEKQIPEKLKNKYLLSSKEELIWYSVSKNDFVCASEKAINFEEPYK